MNRLGLFGVALLGLAVFILSLPKLTDSSATATDSPMAATNSSPAVLQPEDVIAHSLAASIQLYAEREGGVHRWASGVAVASGGERVVFLTAAHLLVPLTAQTVYAIIPGSGARVEATILGVDEKSDVAILEATLPDVAPVGLQSSARLGDDVWVVSFPWGRRGTVVRGAVSQIIAEAADTRLPVSGPVGLIDAAVSYGTSGGGVFDARTGQLIGLVRGYRTAKLSLPGAPQQTLDIPIAGETTVIPTPTIRCVVARTNIEEPVKSLLIGPAAEKACSDA
jgi:S1-C subfamily serine protease